MQAAYGLLTKSEEYVRRMQLISKAVCHLELGYFMQNEASLVANEVVDLFGPQYLSIHRPEEI